MSPRDERTDELYEVSSIDESVNDELDESPSDEKSGESSSNGMMSPSTSTDSLVSTASSTVSTVSSKKAVKFGSVIIREYNRIPGDHPDTRVGPPITISWEYAEQPAKSLDDYEQTRPTKRMNLRLSSITRKNILRNVFEIAEEDIEAAEREAQKVQKLREKTSSQGKVSSVVENVFLSMKRKIKRRVSKDAMMFDTYPGHTNAMLSIGVF